MTVYLAKTISNDCSLKIRVRQKLACLTIDYAPVNGSQSTVPPLHSSMWLGIDLEDHNWPLNEVNTHTTFSPQKCWNNQSNIIRSPLEINVRFLNKHKILICYVYTLELVVFEKLNHLAAVLYVYAVGLIFMK